MDGCHPGLPRYAYWPVVDSYTLLAPGEIYGAPTLQVQTKKRHVLRQWAAQAMAPEGLAEACQTQRQQQLAAIDVERDRRIALANGIPFQMDRLALCNCAMNAIW